MSTQTNYKEQAENFLNETNTEFRCEFVRYGKHFNEDKEGRDIYKITLTRGRRSFSFDFGQSLMNSTRYRDKLNNRIYSPDGKGLNCNSKIVTIPPSKFLDSYCIKIKGEPPTAYDVLVCLQKYNPGTFENFCSEFGYDTDSRTAERIYKAVVNEWQNLQALFNDEEIEKLQEIQ